MFVHQLLRSLSISNDDITNRFGSLIIDKFKYLDEVISVFITFPEYLNNTKYRIRYNI